MDQENKTLQSENGMMDDPHLVNADKEEILVPDDAFAQDDLNGKKSAEMLPQSLAENENEFPDEEDELFTDEEIAAFSKSELTENEYSEALDEAEGEKAEASDDFASVTEKEKQGTPKARRIESTFDVLEMFVFALAFVLIAMAFCFRHSVVDGSSMENTLFDQEHLIISDLFYSPKTGDIVVVQDYSKNETHPELAKPIVKRVIATEGQTVRILENGEVYVDDQLLKEEYVYIDEGAIGVYTDMELTVPAGAVFLMGDHRNISMDSRRGGVFSEDAILGRVILRFLPFDRFGIVK